jgi:phospholipase C
MRTAARSLAGPWALGVASLCLAVGSFFGATSGCSSSHGESGPPGAAEAGEAGQAGEAGVVGQDGDASDAGGAGGDGAVTTPPQWDLPVTRPDDATASANRAACKYGRGDMPAATLGPSFPVDDAMPVDNIVVVMMENHSFDSYFGHLGAYADASIESPPADASNPGVDGGTVPWVHAPHLCSLDTNHEWAGTHQEIDHGKMDGFVTVNEGWDESAASGADPSLFSGARAMWWYDQTDLPFYYALGSTYAIADHYHAAVPGPTWPNRMYLFAATSFGRTTNAFPDISAYPFPTNDASVLDELEKRHVPWMLYTDGLPGAGTVYGLTVASRFGRTVTASFSAFVAAAQAGTLPRVAFVDPNLTSEGSGQGTDEHPPGDIQSGQLFVSQVVQAVTSSPQWSHVALFITHDENGGFYDHISPPAACAPDSTAPILQAGDTTDGGFDLEGVRVLLVAVSPYAKRAYVGHHVYDHTSITRFIEAKFKIPALTARDANAEPLTDLFDFSAPTFATPPALPTPTVDDAGYAYCVATFPPN